MSGGDEVKEREREREHGIEWYRGQDPVPCFASFCYMFCLALLTSDQP